ncbi:hypothetical protein QTO31_14805 [Chloroflexus sp. MS-CIW-1]|jgi:hypothetical protein|uniref:hypothetical protein n=1 Tax=Chloroflexus sp. MS-CIW-1 TaxID=3055768 RepID=UPI002649E4E2|nr:hypothetical protein [Chloroflexus sp. MS-CIW-1]MDN5273238.1 hypothetical protein [Chloroflexus sp. MS-CIW-1]
MEKKLETPREVRMLDVFSACIAERASLSASTRVEEQGQMAILRSLLAARRPHLAQKEVSWENGGELKASSHSSHITALDKTVEFGASDKDVGSTLYG